MVVDAVHLSIGLKSEKKIIFGPDMVQEAEEQVRLIQANLKIAQSRQKSYADKRSSPPFFEVGDHVYLKVSPWKGVQRFGIKGKLAPHTSVHIQLWKDVVLWLTDWIFQRIFLQFIIFSMYHNSESALEVRLKLLKVTQFS